MEGTNYIPLSAINSPSAIGESESAAGERPSELCAVLLYQNRSAGLRARLLFEHASRLFTGTSPLSPVMWRFDLLEEPEMYATVLNDAFAAVIILLSVHGACDLPESANRWLDQWLAQRSDDPCALIVSFDAAARHSSSAARMVDSLHSRVRPKGVTLFHHFGGVQFVHDVLDTEESIYQAGAREDVRHANDRR